MPGKSCPDCIQLRYAGKGPQRVDLALVELAPEHPRLKGVTRSQVKNWVRDGLISVNGIAAKKAGLLLEEGDLINISPQVFRNGFWSSLEPLEMALKIVYQDRDIIVIDKPAGLSVHPGAGNRRTTLVNALLALPGISGSLHSQVKDGDLRPGIVHRLDKDTSGLLVIALNVPALQRLSMQFSKHSIERGYYALVYSTPRGRRLLDRQDSGTIDTMIGRDASDRTRMAVRKSGGRRAVTHWRIVQRMPYANLVELRLETGRTHQIRVHMAHCACPVIGDRTYAGKLDLPPPLLRAAAELGRQALHAYKLGFDHPQDRRHLSFHSGLPQDFCAALRAFGGRSGGL